MPRRAWAEGIGNIRGRQQQKSEGRTTAALQCARRGSTALGASDDLVRDAREARRGQHLLRLLRVRRRLHFEWRGRSCQFARGKQEAARKTERHRRVLQHEHWQVLCHRVKAPGYYKMHYYSERIEETQRYSNKQYSVSCFVQSIIKAAHRSTARLCSP